ncbi:substrate-binding periplasmic protein [Roseateles sp. L2-2]|uniref:substrate-binding periplasmic protein n=1 Tax=Roseateles sp. L2-2 TaxID=3422597 RepID=UPI003D361DDB
MDALRRHLLRHAALGAMAVGMTGAMEAAQALPSSAGAPGGVGGPGAGRPRSTQVLIAGTTFARLFEPAPAGGKPSGLAVDVLDAILIPAGLQPRYEFYPWLRAQSMIEHGPTQILVGPYRTPEREKLMRFSRQAFYEDALVFYARRREEGLWWGDFQALVPLRIGAVQGWVYGDRFEQARRGLNVTAVRDLNTALRMLQLDRLDLIAANQRNSEPVIQELGMTDQVALCAPPFAQLRGHFAFSRDAAGEPWMALVDAGMQRLRASGELQQMAARRGVALPD